MENIFKPDQNFDFSKLDLDQPKSIQGGAFFSKILNDNMNLYIETPKCKTKDGIINSGKKYYSDLLFTNTNDEFIQWLETLEDTIKKLIYSKRKLWFENSLDEDDIDTAFSSLIRTYKSGQFYLLRCHALKEYNLSKKLDISIYDEDENLINEKQITNNDTILSILEINGLKFSARNFQLEIGIKQIMLIKDEPLFSKCLIKKGENNKIENQEIHKNYVKVNTRQELNNKINDVINEQTKEEVNTETNQEINEKTKEELKENSNEDSNENLEINSLDNDIEELELTHLADDFLNNNTKNEDNCINDVNKDLEKEDLEKEDLENIKSKELNETNENIASDALDETSNLEEINLEEINLNNFNENLDDSNSLELKNKNEIYLNLYKNAKRKAINAKKQAIVAYLEAKNIKRQHIIDNNDSENSSEISDLSEISELNE